MSPVFKTSAFNNFTEKNLTFNETETCEKTLNEYKGWNSEIKPLCMLHKSVFLLNYLYFYFVSFYFCGKLTIDIDIL